MTEIDVEIQDLRRQLEQKTREADAHRRELNTVQDALSWTRHRLQDAQEEIRRLKLIILKEAEVKGVRQ